MIKHVCDHCGDTLSHANSSSFPCYWDETHLTMIDIKVMHADKDTPSNAPNVNRILNGKVWVDTELCHSCLIKLLKKLPDQLTWKPTK